MLNAIVGIVDNELNTEALGDLDSGFVVLIYDYVVVLSFGESSSVWIIILIT